MDISVASLLGVVVWLCIIGGVCWLLWWLVGFIGLPEPFNKVARGIIAVVAVVLLINLLLGLAGHSFIRLR
jgi:hypothetical protein